jgi:hypothetical protein
MQSRTISEAQSTGDKSVNDWKTSKGIEIKTKGSLQDDITLALSNV